MIVIVKKYLLPTIVLIFSFLGATILPVTDVFKGLVALPGVAALFYALFQLMRDEWQHNRNLILQGSQQNFILSTSSHVAEVAYDKHVFFCEEYIKCIQEGRQELLLEGATPRTINIGAKLVRIRQKHSAWLTDEIEEKLKPFENALIEIGAKESYLERTSKEGMNEKKREVIDKIFRSFGLVLGHEKPLNDAEADLHIDKAVDKIRDILGIKAVTKLRTNSIEMALKRLE